MSKMKLLLPLIACMTLAACQTSGSLLKPQSAPPTKLPAQTDQIKVTVACGEHEPDQKLPDYPMPSPGSDLVDYSTAQSTWAIQVTGVYQAEKTLRRSTALCLDQLRAKGLIN